MKNKNNRERRGTKTMEKGRKNKRRVFGRLIRNARDLQSISREELARGICSVKTLEKYESGEREPEKLTADALFQRLKKSMEKFEMILSHIEYQRAKQRLEIQMLLRRGEFGRAEQKIEAYAKIKKSLHYQYACFLRAELLRKKSAPLKEQMENVVDGIDQTLEVRGENSWVLKPEILAAGRYSKMELLLLERYAILLFERGDTKEALCWYQEIITYLEDKEYDRADQYTLYPIMAYQLAIYYEGEGEYVTARKWVCRGCEMLRQKKEQLALFCKLMELKFRIEDRAGMGTDEEEREDYRRLCSAVLEGVEEWRQNWYPMYTEKHLLCFNYIIRERRLAKGMSKEELAYGICDVRTLERIEACENTPRTDNKEKLLEKLGLPTEKYNGGIVTGRYEDYRKCAEMMKLCRENKYYEAEEIYNELKKGMGMKNITNIQWAEYWKIRINQGLGHISVYEKNQRLWNLLQKTIPLKKGYLQFECQMMRYERNILNRIVEEERGESERSRKILLKQIQIYYQKWERELIEPEYFIQLLAQLGNRCRLEEKSVLALRYFRMAEKEMIWTDFWDIWEYILCYKQLVMQNMSTEKNNFQCAQQAYAISRLYAKNNLMCDYLIQQYDESILKN